MFRFHLLTGAALAFATVGAAQAQAPAAAPSNASLNVYSARHYQTDEALYDGFTRATGIKINRVDADDAGLLARLKTEGASSPADVILLVDASRLWRAEVDGLFQPVKSKTLETRIPASLRGKDEGQGSSWFGMSTRARVIVYNKAKVARDDVDTYEELGEAKNKGRVCTRSGSHPYNLSLFGALYEHWGAQSTQRWLTGMVGNMARSPKGGDTDQIMAVASGECSVALTNTYYLARLMRSQKPQDREAVEKVGVVFPNQSSFGTHVNIAGAAVARNAKNPQAARQFLEYLASEAAQQHFADGNNEWPVVSTLKIDNPALVALGKFKAETTPVSVIGMNQIPVQRMLDQVGYK